MIGGVIAVIIITTVNIGGFSDVWRIASEGNRTDVLKLENNLKLFCF